MCNPISVFLQAYRTGLGKTQQTVAEEVGYEQSYYSQIERGTKTPSTEFLQRLAARYAMDEPTRARMWEEARHSQRKYFLPAHLPLDVFRLYAELWEKLDQLHPSVVSVLRAVIQLESGSLTSRSASEIAQRTTEVSMH